METELEMHVKHVLTEIVTEMEYVTQLIFVMKELLEILLILLSQVMIVSIQIMMECRMHVMFVNLVKIV